MSSTFARVTACDPQTTIEPAATAQRVAWWREGAFWLLALLVVGIYFTRIEALTIRGEESRWAEVAREMIATGNWIVPQQQGTVFADRPPLGPWAIAGAMQLTGSEAVWVVRLPSLLATLATALIIYIYLRTFSGPAVALAGGAIYATSLQVLDLGRRAESEAVLTCLVAASLLLWHRGHTLGRSRALLWALGYSLAALAALAKGLQGPIYFVAVTWLYLLVRRDWRSLLCAGHLVGLGCGLLVLGAWQVPCMLALDAESLRRIWGEQASARFQFNQLTNHLLLYPLEVIGCLLPWSTLLVLLMVRPVRQTVFAANSPGRFLLLSLLVTFPSVWLATGAQGRYFMPLYPCAAALLALTLDAGLRPAAFEAMRRPWRALACAICALLLLISTGLLALNIGQQLPQTAPLIAQRLPAGAVQPLGLTLAYLLAAGGAVATIWRCRDRLTPRSAATLVVAYAAMLGLTYTACVTNLLAAQAADTAGGVERLREQLPPETRLVSFEIVHHVFRYHYGQPVARLDWPITSDEVPAELDYFCFSGNHFGDRDLPFAWEPIAQIICDRHHHDPPRDYVTVGRRCPSPRTATPPTASPPTITAPPAMATRPTGP